MANKDQIEQEIRKRFEDLYGREPRSSQVEAILQLMIEREAQIAEKIEELDRRTFGLARIG